MNSNRVLCCFKIKAATLFISICDLIAHIIIIFGLCGTLSNKLFINLNITIDHDPNYIDIMQAHLPHGPSKVSGLYTRTIDYNDFNSRKS
jgi:hypothetical protein